MEGATSGVSGTAALEEGSGVGTSSGAGRELGSVVCVDVVWAGVDEEGLLSAAKPTGEAGADAADLALLRVREVRLAIAQGKKNGLKKGER